MDMLDFVLFAIESVSGRLTKKIHKYRAGMRTGIKKAEGRKMIKLDLGCGGAKRKGFLGIDVILGPGVDLEHNLLEGIPFKTKTVDEIYSSHFLEHLPDGKIVFLISECARVLKKEGKIEIEVPDLDAVLRKFLEMDEATREKKGWDWIFGNQRTEYEYHRTGFDRARLEELLKEAGFYKITFESYKDGEIPSIRVKARRSK